MAALSLENLSLLLGVVGFACLAWPIWQRLSGRTAAPAPGSGASLRSPLWWFGFVLTVAAIALQRFANP